MKFIMGSCERGQVYTNTTSQLKAEISAKAGMPPRADVMRAYYYGIAYAAHEDESVPVKRAYAFAEMLRRNEKYVYKNDIILGSLRSLYGTKPDDKTWDYYCSITNSYPERGWTQGRDHYASAFDRLLEKGVDGIIAEIDESLEHHRYEKKKVDFLRACRISMEAFSECIMAFAAKANSPEAREACINIANKPASGFHEALQLVWFAHTMYLWQGLYAMALGRLDQYLYPYYKKDIESGKITRDDAVILLENAFMKMHEYRVFYGGDDVCNIAIGGITPSGEDAVNDLTYDILRAVCNCYIPGPNLSARVNEKNPDEFVCSCLKVIGTGLGYPAMMSDKPNIAALKRMGYAERDANNYCMVGCIENFLPGMQPPHTDGRFNTPKYLEYVLFRGKDPMSGDQVHPDLGDPRDFASMDEFMQAFEKQLRIGADRYAIAMISSTRPYGEYNGNYCNPFLSCLSYHCVERGLDLCDGGSRYPSEFSACGMGIGTIADSLAAIEKTVYKDRSITMDTLIKALEADFEGYEKERQLLLAVPKYGNDCDETDKYAEWFVSYSADLFDRYRLRDGGRFYTAIASNVQNIGAGQVCAASPSGRRKGEPLSDAASPTYGLDTKGPTYTVASVSKPDYSRVACGTVVNQKFSPAVFSTEENIKRMCALLRVYFRRGGQEMQINSVSREELIDAMEHPENYGHLVVRVSGFSAYFTKLGREVQLDILHRTEQA